MDQFKANLLQLAAHLDTRPAETFDMSFYATQGIRDALPDTAHECGTVCCALGSGPAAGLVPMPWEDWEEYSERIFGIAWAGPAWRYLFSAKWREYEPSPQEAAARIRHFVEHGLPKKYRPAPGKQWKTETETETEMEWEIEW